MDKDDIDVVVGLSFPTASSWRGATGAIFHGLFTRTCCMRYTMAKDFRSCH